MFDFAFVKIRILTESAVKMNSNFPIKSLAPIMRPGCSHDNNSDIAGLIYDMFSVYTEVVFTNPCSIDNP